jgi:hypothetical protein
MQTQNIFAASTHETGDTLKVSILAALRKFVGQRPGLDFANYGDAAAYRAESRSITRDLNHAKTLLRKVETASGISGLNLIEATRGSRLKIVETLTGHKVEYCTGQYFPTEYRRAVAAVCAGALWDYIRETSMPAPVYFVEWQNERGEYARANREPLKQRDAAEWLATLTRNQKEKEKEKAAFATPPHGYGYTTIREAYRTPKGYISGGDWLRAYFVREFGRGIASRFFN